MEELVVDQSMDNPVLELSNDKDMRRAVSELRRRAMEQGCLTAAEIDEYVRKVTIRFPKFWQLYFEVYRNCKDVEVHTSEPQSYRIKIGIYGFNYQEFEVVASSKSQARQILYDRLRCGDPNDKLVIVWKNRKFPIEVSIEEFKNFLENESYWLSNHPIMERAVESFTLKYKSCTSFGAFLDAHFECEAARNSENTCSCDTFSHEREKYWTGVCGALVGSKWASVEFMSILSIAVDLYQLTTPYDVIKTISKKIGLPYINKYKMIERLN